MQQELRKRKKIPRVTHMLESVDVPKRGEGVSNSMRHSEIVDQYAQDCRCIRKHKLTSITVHVDRLGVTKLV